MRKERAIAIVDRFVGSHPRQHDPDIGPISACVGSIDGREGLSVDLGCLDRDGDGHAYLSTRNDGKNVRLYIDGGTEAPEKDPDVSGSWFVVGDWRECMAVDIGHLPRDEDGRPYLAAYRPGKHIRFYC